MTKITILDGGMGQELVHRTGRTPTGLWSCELMMERPDLVSAIHDDFFAAGADVATVNSYTLHRDRLRPAGLEDQFEQLHKLACDLARQSQQAHGSGLIAGCLGPLGWSYSHDGAPSETASTALYEEICRLQEDKVDLFVIETIASLSQARASLSAAQQFGKPVWIGLTVDDQNGKELRSGEPLDIVLKELERFEPDAVLLNCSVPEAITTGLGILGQSGFRTGAYANGFTAIKPEFLKKGSSVSNLSARTDLTPSAYADHATTWIDLGATIIGGCCEVGPEHIAELSRRFAKATASDTGAAHH
ncbi:homocysteine S-methyltransferase family protein [Labrenzia sp. VG12]|uniref:homocysteine S-methyltransferase family protein n=1 Tax=Labrenzia sp. VG12 TaxID=2021862 RepID=UPI000B8C491C|nr:homocysteine S-methyltransferase family protein [Labrenzia sp. VG12]ASP33586.1 homocysteine S-methyltransferase [Labrenzia sp. VG12]